MSSAVLLQENTKYGKALFAARKIRAGEVVLDEEPFLFALKPDHPLVQIAQRLLSAKTDAESLRRAVPRLALFLAWCLAPDATQQQLLRDFCCTTDSGIKVEDCAALQRDRDAAVLFSEQLMPLLRNHLPEGTTADPAVIEKVLLVWNINAHAIDDPDSGDDRQALLELGSKLTHTCGDANTQLSGLLGRGRHIAVRDIQPGELLTTYYIGEQQLLRSTHDRQFFLQVQYGFKCRCDRCSLPTDSMRVLPCPSCVPRAADGSLPAAIAQGKEQPVGLMVYTLATAAATAEEAAANTACYSQAEAAAGTAPVHDGSSRSDQQDRAAAGCGGSSSAAAAPAAASWHCSTCGLTVPNDDISLYGRKSWRPGGCSLESYWERMTLLCDNSSQLMTPDAQAYAARVSSDLGPAHWTANTFAMAALGMTLQDLAHPLKVVSFAAMNVAQLSIAVAETEADLQRMWDWVVAARGGAKPAACTIIWRLVLSAKHLLTCRDLLAGTLGTQHPLLERLPQLASKVLGWAEPALQWYRSWQSEPLDPVVKEAAALQARCASAPVPMAVQPMFTAMHMPVGARMSVVPGCISLQ